MKDKFPDWFGSQIRQCYVDKDPCVSASNELFALACGPTPTPISVNSFVVNGVRFVVHRRNECRTTQNSGICSLGGKDGEMYYGHLQEILEFSYLLFKVVLFRVKWFDTSNEGCKDKHLVLRNNMTQIWAKEDDPDVIHFDNSSDLALSTSLNDLDFATMHIDGQSTDVDAPPDIIDVDKLVGTYYQLTISQHKSPTNIIQNKKELVSTDYQLTITKSIQDQIIIKVKITK
ncbi:hypothetical protein Tco_1185297 [Tanacetum coccineum]